VRRDHAVGLGEHVVGVDREVQMAGPHLGVVVRGQSERRPARDQPAFAAEAGDLGVRVDGGEAIVEMAAPSLPERDLLERSFGR
jgi:hypothetical protein